jgi:mono/diheme cytochrome c family protein
MPLPVRIANPILGTAVSCGLGLLLLTSVAPYAETGKRPAPASVQRGAELYDTYCLACHRTDGVGEPVAPWSIRRPDFIEAMPLNETSHAWHHGDEQLMVIILDGTPRSKTRMPVFRGALSEEHVSDLIAYMKSLWSDRILSCQGPKHMSCM